jgi:O-antigen ligase
MTYVAFVCFFLSGVQTAVTYLLFQSAPRWGTGTTIGISCATLYLAGILLLAVGAQRVIWPGPAKWILAYSALTGLSLIWSQSSSLPHATGYWIGFIAEFSVVVCFLKLGDVDRITVAALSGFIWAAAVVAIIAWTAPGTWEQRMGDQEYLHPNAIGNQFGLAALFGLYLARRNLGTKYWNWITLGLTFSLLRSLSKASIISFFLAAGFYLFRCSGRNFRTHFKYVLISMALFAISWTFIQSYLEIYTEGTNVETLTGRTIIWATSLDIANERPWLGHGFYSYRSVVPSFGEFESWHAHNDFLQQYFSYGIVGLSLAIGIYVSFFRHLRSCQQSSPRTLGLALLIYGLLHGVTDADHIELMLPIRFILLFSVWASSRVMRDDEGSFAPTRAASHYLTSV